MHNLQSLFLQTTCLKYITSIPCPSLTLFVFQPDRGAKRPREEDGGAGGEEDNSRGGKQIKGLAAKELARYREAEGGAEMRETEELTGDGKMMLDKLMDEVEEELEVGNIYVQFLQVGFTQSSSSICT